MPASVRIVDQRKATTTPLRMTGMKTTVRSTWKVRLGLFKVTASATPRALEMKTRQRVMVPVNK